MKSSLALIWALFAAAVAVILSRYSVSDICGWYLTDRGAAHEPAAAKAEIHAEEAVVEVVEDVEEEDVEEEDVEEEDVEESAACQLSGTVPHCGCSYAAVESMNLNSMRSILSELVQTPFFRYFKTVRRAG